MPQADGKKLLVSLAMEGKFASDRLQAIDDGDDILMAMARELVTEKGIGENAAAVWKELQRQQAEVFGVHAVEVVPSDTGDEPTPDPVPEGIASPPESTVIAQLLEFGTSLESVRRRKGLRSPTAAVPTTDQLALF